MITIVGRMRGGLGMGLCDRKTLVDGPFPVVASKSSGKKEAARRRSSVPPCPPTAGTPPLAFKGHRATVIVWPERVEIDRTFLGRLNGNYSVSIPWQRVAGIDLADPGRLVNGHVHFAIESGLPALTAAGRGRRGAAVARSPHAIMFTWRQRATYERLRDLLTGN
jgi:hypothetical protein